MVSKKYQSFDKDPWWTTQVRKSYGAMMVGIDNQAWLYYRVPSGPVVDAVNSSKMIEVGSVIEEAIEGISALTGPTRTKRRSLDRGSYREGHLLTINIPRRFDPPEVETRELLRQEYSHRRVQRRITVLGIKLKSTTGGGTGIRAAVESVRHTLLVGGVPLEDYDKDRRAVEAVFSRSGLRIPTGEELKLLNSWWNNGSHADIPYMPHGDHLHVFNSENSARAAKRFEMDTETTCDSWDAIPGEHTLSFSTVSSFDADYREATDPGVQWGASLLDSGAVAVSARFLIEPSTITREELRRNKKSYIDDIRERQQQNKMGRAEQDEMTARLSEVEAMYSGGRGTAPSTLTDLAVTVVTTGRHERHGYDPTEMGEIAGLGMDSMLARQDSAFVDTMMCSSIRKNPHLHDLPSTALAYAGLTDLSVAGDRPRKKGAVAMLGFSERDKQPMWMDAMAATDEDSVPIALVVGQSGSGKSVLMQWLADQYARTTNDLGEKTPVIMIDLKEKSNFTPTVSLTGGTVFNLSSLVSDGAKDGVFDPIRFSTTAQLGIDRAHSLIMQVNPFGTNSYDFETPLRQALQYGVDNGAVCTGQALEMAYSAKINDEIVPIYQRVRAATESPILRAVIGFNPDSPGLRVSGGTTYIRIGDMSLDLPSPGTPVEEQTPPQRHWLALVKAMVYGSISALAERQGVVLFDEGWIFLGSGRSEMEAMGRLARSQQVFPIIFTQRTQDALKAELEGYISRGIILPIEDENEARAALKLFKLEQTLERITRITGKVSKTSDGGDEWAAPNWQSFRALRGPDGRSLRGTIGMYVDLAGNAVPTEISLSESFIKKASTRREDVAERRASEAG